MTISLQLIDIPEHEQVASRQLSLPETGGTIGRSFECTIQLPDFNRTLSRTHVEIVKQADSAQYLVIDRSRNGTFLNNELLGQGHRKVIKDGDHLRIGGYLLLISMLDALFETRNDDQAQTSAESTPAAHFSLASVQQEDPNFEPVQPTEHSATSRPSANRAFSSQNALADDAFGYDPFEQDDFEVPSLTNEPLSSLDKNSDTHSLIEQDSSSLVSNSLQKQFDQNLTQLNQIVEKQSRLAAQAEPTHEQLLDTLQETLASFLEELNPEHLEEEFSDFVGGWGNKDKKYWALYRKQFQRKLRKQEYHRQFMALFMEALRKSK